MSTPPDVRLTLPARPEGVAVVRQALAGMADALAFDAAVVADMKMAISEACTNVVVHAYEEERRHPRGGDVRRARPGSRSGSATTAPASARAASAAARRPRSGSGCR